MNNIIAISGLRGSGKTSVSRMLEFLLNTPKIFHSYFWFKHKYLVPKKHNYKTVAFADPIKEILSHLLNMDREDFESREIKENCFVNFSSFCKVYTNGIGPQFIPEYLPDSKFSKLAKE